MTGLEDHIPADGSTTTSTKLDVTVAASPPVPGHHWYLAVQPLNQPGAHYFHKALPVDNTHYLATVGIGPAGSLGKGSYIVSLMDTDATAAAAITREITGNTLHYNNHGMPPPEGATSTH